MDKEVQEINDLLDFELVPIVPDASSGDGIIRTDQQMQEWAEICNCEVVKAKPNQLFIDIDTKAQYETFKLMFHLFDKHFFLIPYGGYEGKKQKWEEHPSKQGLPHRHIVVTLNGEQSLITRIAMQAVLSSDPMREMLSIRRALNCEENVVVFFEPKVEKDK